MDLVALRRSRHGPSARDLRAFLPTTREEMQAGLDPQMHAALEWLLDGQDVSKGTKVVTAQ